MGTEKERKKTLIWLTNLINNSPDKIFDKNKLVAQIKYCYGVRTKTAEDYINTLIDAEIINETGEGVRAKKEAHEIL